VLEVSTFLGLRERKFEARWGVAGEAIIICFSGRGGQKIWRGLSVGDFYILEFEKKKICRKMGGWLGEEKILYFFIIVLSSQREGESSVTSFVSVLLLKKRMPYWLRILDFALASVDKQDVWENEIFPKTDARPARTTPTCSSSTRKTLGRYCYLYSGRLTQASWVFLCWATSLPFLTLNYFEHYWRGKVWLFDKWKSLFVSQYRYTFFRIGVLLRSHILVCVYCSSFELTVVVTI